MAQFKFVQWLIRWLYETAVFQFEWDDGNTTKSSAKHGVTVKETEEVFQLKKAQPLGVQISPAVSEERLGIIGPTARGRILYIVFTLRAGKVRPISARLAGRKERTSYETFLREIT